MRTLYLKNIQKYDAGEYTCTGESGGKTSQDSGIIIIEGNPSSSRALVRGGGDEGDKSPGIFETKGKILLKCEKFHLLTDEYWIAPPEWNF